ncbi:hypothetical protein EPR50_G00198760 [Perca flavescens]|uniref:Uncharacterized protein n=1 Tax=Perca flavescens TaxID=8167 RepID=A0A484C7G7_PERFV|nr:hypothetical protein EPR50_G00198760 [Perca flavescens]
MKLFSMSNEIFRLCFQSISLDRIFKGYVIFSKHDLSDRAEASAAWPGKTFTCRLADFPQVRTISPIYRLNTLRVF